ncbi:MAG: hypothetical protein IAF38_18405, partial [Bacteroidia bacterium]|nr:hypothetical protein [Bacteroidia bacterium]
MKKYLQIAFVLILVLLSCLAKAQQAIDIKNADGFNEEIIKEHFFLHHPDGKGWEEFLSARLTDYKNRNSSQALKMSAINPVTNAACTNIDFEQGTMNGWNVSTGYNPNYNVIGCCASPGGAQAIMSGAGTDACGGFPVVAPGGSFSLMLGNSAVNGVADRIEQTFTVAANNTFFSYRYAVVLEDPGHAVTDQPSFQIEMLDSSGNQIPCAQYQVSAGQGIPGFQNSATCPGVVYKPWSNVTIDLSGYLGQNVTIRFTTYDCALGGHFGYAYLDGACLQFQSVVNDTVCSNSTLQLFGISGAGSWLWSGTGVNGATTQNVTINSPGNYSVSSVS